MVSRIPDALFLTTLIGPKIVFFNVKTIVGRIRKKILNSWFRIRNLWCHLVNNLKLTPYYVICDCLLSHSFFACLDQKWKNFSLDWRPSQRSENLITNFYCLQFFQKTNNIVLPTSALASKMARSKIIKANYYIY